jgi:hypothetical protein
LSGLGITRVLKEVILSSIKILAALPAAIIALAGLQKIGQESGYNVYNSKSFDKLSNIINTLLYILIEHWFACIILSVLGGTIWALLVVEPKVKAQDAFEQQRKDRLGE